MPRRKTLPLVGDLCSFCQQKEEHPLLGALVKTDEILLHSNCIFAASGLSQEKEDGKTEGDYVEGFHISAIQKELRRGRLLTCSFCRRHGATVGCVVGSCPRSFHLPCITKAQGVTIFEDPFPSYCKRHAPKQDLEPWFRLNAEAPLCSVCLFSILPEDSSHNSTPKSEHSDTTPMVSVPSIPMPEKTEPKRLTRRSCVTVSTPKCIQVSNGMSYVKRRLSLSNGSSTWELPDSPQPPDCSELDANLLPQTPCPKAEALLQSSLPTWLDNYLNKLPARHRSSAYANWQYNTVHGMCCPKAWMHRSCITGFAVSAALHYVKCPYCADKQTFIRSIIDAGIWVPDRDAAWELEPGAFADLAPVDENGESSSSSSDSDTTETGNVNTNAMVVNSVERPSRLLGSIGIQTEPSVPSEASDSECLGINEPPQLPAQPIPSRRAEQSKPILSLVWTPQLNQSQRGRRLSRPRRFTHQPTFDHPKSPPQPTATRRVRRRLSLYSRDSVSLGSHVESRLRQVTLGAFLASLRMSSVPE